MIGWCRVCGLAFLLILFSMFLPLVSPDQVPSLIFFLTYVSLVPAVLLPLASASGVEWPPAGREPQHAGRDHLGPKPQPPVPRYPEMITATNRGKGWRHILLMQAQVPANPPWFLLAALAGIQECKLHVPLV